MSATGKIPPREAGQTLIEMLVALAILTLIVGIAMPAIGRLIARRALVEAEGAVITSVAQAHRDAVANATTVVLTLSTNGDRLTSSTGAAGPALPDGVRLDWPQAGVAFHGDGSATAWDGALIQGDTIHRFHLDGPRARVEFAA